MRARRRERENPVIGGIDLPDDVWVALDQLEAAGVGILGAGVVDTLRNAGANALPELWLIAHAFQPQPGGLLTVIRRHLSKAWLAGYNDGLEDDLDGYRGRARDAVRDRDGWADAAVNAMGEDWCRREWAVRRGDAAWRRACGQYDEGVHTALRERAGDEEEQTENEDDDAPHGFLVWGVGPARSNLIRDADAATWVELPVGAEWIVEVYATEDEVNAATRYDRAVLGFHRITDED